MKITGTGEVTSADFKQVKWEGLTKGGNAVTITLFNAINMGNIDWTFAEKNDVVPSIEFTACYTNTDAASDSTIEPFEVEINGSSVNASDGIILGAGKFYIGETLVALTRGGGQFTVEREYREINADGDRGAVGAVRPGCESHGPDRGCARIRQAEGGDPEDALQKGGDHDLR